MTSALTKVYSGGAEARIAIGSFLAGGSSVSSPADGRISAAFRLRVCVGRKVVFQSISLTAPLRPPLTLFLQGNSFACPSSSDRSRFRAAGPWEEAGMSTLGGAFSTSACLPRLSARPLFGGRPLAPAFWLGGTASPFPLRSFR